jgi:hypothetical protein
MPLAWLHSRPASTYRQSNKEKRAQDAFTKYRELQDRYVKYLEICIADPEISIGEYKYLSSVSTSMTYEILLPTNNISKECWSISS